MKKLFIVIVLSVLFGHWSNVICSESKENPQRQTSLSISNNIASKKEQTHKPQKSVFQKIKKRVIRYYEFLKHLIIINFRLLSGMWKLSRVPQPAITIFGSSRTPMDHKDAQDIYKLSKKLALNGFTVITGGGTGIMLAANKGAFDAQKELSDPTLTTSVGITLSRFVNKKSKFEDLNSYIHETIIMDHFFFRKWLMVRYSTGFILPPGGYGTLDELFDVITMIQCKEMKKVPVILLNKKFWEPIKDHIYNRLLKQNMISKGDEDLLTITDDIDEAYRIIAEAHTKELCPNVVVEAS
jgi:uncharacterized protein (TIGR00730 family)